MHVVCTVSLSLSIIYRRQRDPGCEAEEAKCKSEIQPLAEAMTRTKEEMDKSHDEVNKESSRMQVEMEGLPEHCREELATAFNPEGNSRA